jgi:hypothetical protein
MKLTAIAIVAAGALALFTTSPAVAANPSATPSHANLAHRSADRQQTYDTARRLGLSHSQTDRLKSDLQHQARDDQQVHRSGSTNGRSYQNYTPNYRSTQQAHGSQAQLYRTQPQPRNYVAPHNRYSNQRVQSVAPSYRSYVPSHNNNGLTISTPNFSLQLGH